MATGLQRRSGPVLSFVTVSHLQRPQTIFMGCTVLPKGSESPRIISHGHASRRLLLLLDVLLSLASAVFARLPLLMPTAMCSQIDAAHSVGVNAVSWAPAMPAGSLISAKGATQPDRRLVSGGCDNAVKASCSPALPAHAHCTSACLECSVCIWHRFTMSLRVPGLCTPSLTFCFDYQILHIDSCNF